MDPVTAATVGMAAFQVVSGLQQAETIRKNGELQQRINEMNADWAEIDAYKAEVAGMGQSAAYQKQIDAAVSNQKVAYASQDVDVNFGTAAEVQSESRLTGFLNQLDIKNQAHERSLGYKREARNIRPGSSMSALETSARVGATKNAAYVGAASGYISNMTRPQVAAAKGTPTPASEG